MNTRVLLSVLCLCATFDAMALEMYESRPPSHRPPDPEEGLVVVSMSTNSLRLDGIDGLIVESGQARYRLRSVATAFARDYALFIGALPEGKYDVGVIEERDNFKTLTLGPADKNRIGSFEVRRGHRCDLGRLVVTQFTLDLVVG